VVNFTVTISEELKAEMDRYPEVNWSEVFRKNIQSYMQVRQNPTPQLDFEMKEAHVSWNWLLAQPRISVFLRIVNRLAADVLLDRILFSVAVLTSTTREARGGFEGQYLQYRQLSSSKSTDVELSLYPDAELLERLTNKLEATFVLQLDLTACVEGYPNPCVKQIIGKVPIDEWKNEVGTALDSFDRHWGRSRPKKLEAAPK
jgi:hypothetical protein